MMTREPFAVIGGDLRQARAAHLLASDGFTVHAVGFDSDIEMGSEDVYKRQPNDRPVFGRNERNPLDYDSIIVDELSMVDIVLFENLLRAMRLGCRLILVLSLIHI